MMNLAEATRDEVLLETRGSVLWVTLNRPEKRNALSEAVLRQLESIVERLATDRAIHVVVLASRGSVFCSGHDLRELAGRPESASRELFALCSRVMLGLRALPQPVIARVQGMATAAGCQLVAACDLSVAAETATFATPGVKIGLFCTTPMVPLVRTIAPRAALEMLLTGQPISAQRALELGLVNRVVPADALDAAVLQIAEALLSSSPMVLKLGKRAFYDQLALAEPVAYGQAVEIMTANAGCHDAQEGMRAFLEKRQPIWRGE